MSLKLHMHMICIYTNHDTNIVLHILCTNYITAFSTVYSRGAVKSTATRSISKAANNKSVSLIVVNYASYFHIWYYCMFSPLLMIKIIQFYYYSTEMDAIAVVLVDLLFKCLKLLLSRKLPLKMVFQ